MGLSNSTSSAVSVLFSVSMLGRRHLPPPGTLHCQAVQLGSIFYPNSYRRVLVEMAFLELLACKIVS